MKAPFFTVDFYKKRPKVLVFLLTFLIYSPLLFNHYVGDDRIIIEDNTFYHSWKNIPRVLGKGCIFNFQEAHYNYDFGTGKDSYRPISNLTYFLDYYLFGAKPYGSHLINISIHAANAVLVYWIVNQIFSSSVLGIFAGLLFSLHPIQTETVAKMSIRADLLSTMFVLWVFYFWINFKQSGYLKKRYYGGALAMYFLAVFSKETVFILPLVVLLFDLMLALPRPGLRSRGIWYIGFIPIFILFILLYFIVFPSPLVAPRIFHWLGGSWVNHCLIMGYIWCNYLINILMPWSVKAIPGHYCPPSPGIVSLATAGIGAAVIVMTAIACMLWRNYKECVFFILWYVLFYLPVSNLFPITNPMSSHYMYLPSIGLLIVLAVFLHKIFNSDFFKKYSQHLPNLLCAAVIILCVSKNLFLMEDWKSDSDLGFAWVRDYPADYQGYAMIGELYFSASDFKNAKEYLEKSILLGNGMQSDVLTLAECHVLLGQSQAAQNLLEQIVSRYPGNSEGYMLLIKVYLNLHKFDLAEDLLKKAGQYLSAQDVLELQHDMERWQSGRMRRS